MRNGKLGRKALAILDSPIERNEEHRICMQRTGITVVEFDKMLTAPNVIGENLRHIKNALRG